MNHKHYYCSPREETQYSSNDTSRCINEYRRGSTVRANTKSHVQSGKTQINVITMVYSLVLCILIIHCPSQVSASRSPSISQISQEQVIEIGDTLKLKCVTQYSKDYPVHWIRTDPDVPSSSTLISQSNTVVVPSDRYAVSTNDNVNSPETVYNLVINKVQETDAGVYWCEIIIGTSNKIATSTRVIVRIPPVISDNSTRSVITVAGANVDLFCYGVGFPMPRISWRREKNKLIPGYGAMARGNHLKIQNITKDSRGTYYCVADNGVSSGARRSISVEVEFAPVVIVERTRYGQALQYDAILTCKFQSFPSPAVEWHQGSENSPRILNNKNFKISQFSTSEEFVETSLTITKIEKKHFGKYICRASNKLGSGKSEIELFETVNIVCPPSCNTDHFISSAEATKLSTASIASIVIFMLLFKCLM